MSAPFTAAPWTFHEPWAGFSKITGADGSLVFGVARGEPDEAQSVEVCEANARLIEASPELYDALFEILAKARIGYDAEHIADIARNALAKARDVQVSA